MRFNLSVTHGDYEDWPVMSVAAENAGFDIFSIPDSIFYPEETDSIYPYNETKAIRDYIKNTPFVETFVVLAWLAGQTSRIKLFSNVLKTASRQPILLAKQIASLAVISNNRYIYGAGIGPWAEDYVYNNLPWEARGELLDESIEILRGLMTGEAFSYEGKHNKFGPIRINPTPTLPVPVVIGGHSKPALRRAARIGDGWTAVNMKFDMMKETVETLTSLRREYGKEGGDFQIHARESDFRTGGQGSVELDHFRRLEEIGVTDYGVVLLPSAQLPLAAKLDAIHRFGNDVIAKLR